MDWFSLFILGFIAFCFVLIVRSFKLREKINDLEWQVSRLFKLADRVKTLEEQLANLQTPPQAEKKSKEAHPVSPVQSETPAPIQEVKPAVPETVLRPSPARQEIEAPKSRTREEWESFVGGKLLNRIGALALIIGLGFFLKYAFDNDWISETVRVLIGAGVGVVCLGLAYRTHQKGFQIFAQGLVGAGIAILYLSIYASFNFYALTPQWTAFLLMSLVTTLSLVLGMYFNSLAVGILGWAGGFLTPIMLSTGTANEIGLFTYIALLNVGLLAIVFIKNDWYVLEPLSLAATWAMYFAWYFRYYHESDLIVTVFFMSVFWLLFFGLDAARIRLTKNAVNTVQHFTVTANLLLYYSMLYGLINANHHEWMGGLTLALAGIYAASIGLLRRSDVRSDDLTMRSVLSAIVLLVLATAIQYEDLTTVLLWSLEAAALLWCGVHWKKQFVYFAAAGLFAIAAMKFLATDGALAFASIDQFTLILNQRFLTLFVMAGLFGISAFWISPEHETLSSMFQTACCFALFVLCTVETNDFFRSKMLHQTIQYIESLQFTRLMVLSAVWGLLALPMGWLGISKKLTPVLYSSWGILILSTCLAAVRGIQYDPIASYSLILNLRVGALLFVLGALVVYQRMLKAPQNTMEWVPEVLHAIQISIVGIILVLLTGETRDFFEQQINSTQASGEVFQHLHNLEQLSLSAVWLLYSVALMAIGFWRSLRGIRIIAFVLFGITILKIFIYDLSSLDTLYRIFSFIGLGLILLAVSYAYQRYKDIIFGKKE